MELYVHIPFCVRKCRYCSFASFAASEAEQEAYIRLLLKEAGSRRGEMTEPVSTVYIGGGTPSLLPVELLRSLISGILQLYPIRKDAEFTMEANPGTLHPAWLEAARELGVNRLSIGMQAAQESLLRTLGRIHSFPDVEKSVREARCAGFQNISLDLIFGIPGQTEADWEETLTQALALNPTHISAYGLIPEEGTPLTEDLRSGRLTLPDPEIERNMYNRLKQRMLAQGYQQYEISNFARTGYACRHNIGYWTLVPYLGLGLSAASMVRMEKGPEGVRYTRLRNPAGFDEYARMVRENRPEERESETVPPNDARFETMMLGLRMNRGVSESVFLQLHGKQLPQIYGAKLQQLLEKGLVEKEGDRWFLSDRGMDIQNAVLVELME